MSYAKALKSIAQRANDPKQKIRDLYLTLLDKANNEAEYGNYFLSYTAASGCSISHRLLSLKEDEINALKEKFVNDGFTFNATYYIGFDTPNQVSIRWDLVK